MPLDIHQLLAVVVFAVTTCGTPGPNNILIMASGANYGFRRSLPGIAGINIGFPLLVALLGVGFASIIQRNPDILGYLKPLAVGYLLWLAYGLAKSSVPEPGAIKKPAGFWALLGFQAINPKSWIMAVGALSAFTKESGGVAEVLAIAIVFLVCGTPCTAAWCALGAAGRRVLSSERGFRVFNIIMAALLACSAVFILIE